ncbi:MAG: ABC transporter ATP-binding protein [Acidobacteriota bacterium]
MSTIGSARDGLAIAGVTHAYGNFIAVREADLAVRPGEVHCLLGPSGSGKSTILRLIAGLEILQHGSIHIGDREVASAGRHVRPEHRSVGLVFQDYALFPHLDARDNVMFGMPRGARQRNRAAAESLLARVGMTQFTRAMPHTLSGGQQQRVALARALAREPVVMLLDESFSGLDASLRRSVREATLDVLRDAEVATMIVTHDPREALAAGDSVSVLRDGRLMQTGSPAELYEHPVSAEVAEVFGPINRLDGTVRDGRVDTPAGSVPAGDHADGVPVEVLVRPERIMLAVGPESPNAVIDRVSLEGATVLVELRLDDGRVVLVRELARHVWSVGDAVRFSVDPNAVQVVAAD